MNPKAKKALVFSCFSGVVFLTIKLRVLLEIDQSTLFTRWLEFICFAVFMTTFGFIMKQLYDKTKEIDDSYRYTIVYYSLEQMWKCETITDEIIRIRKKKKEKAYHL